MSTYAARKARVRKVAHEIAKALKARYPDMHVKLDFHPQERDEHAYVWITVPNLDCSFEVLINAAGSIAPYWEREGICIVLRVLVDQSSAVQY